MKESVPLPKERLAQLLQRHTELIFLSAIFILLIAGFVFIPRITTYAPDAKQDSLDPDTAVSGQIHADGDEQDIGFNDRTPVSDEKSVLPIPQIADPNIPVQYYTISIYDGKLCVFTDQDALYYTLRTSPSMLSEEDRKILSRGIVVETEDELTEWITLLES